MATFYNQATLSYNGTSIPSNITVGELADALSAAKNSTPSTYSAGDTITYVITIQNTEATAYSGLTVTDNLGAYTYNTSTLYPLAYESGSVLYYVNNVLQTAPTITAGPPLQFSGISIPANGTVTLVYTATANEFASPESGASITNTMTVAGENLSDITADNTITAVTAPDLSISKGICPAKVTEDGQVTYTFSIQNTGNTAAAASDNLSITDTFNPVLSNISVTYNNVPWSSPTQYSYNTSTGLFTTTAGMITVPAASYTQDTATGAWTTVPGTSTLVVTGTIS